MVATGHVKNDGKVVKKKTKVVSDVLTGKRVLDLSIANNFLPPKSFFHETTDGLRLRIFYGRQRWSTSGLLKMGHGAAVLKCLKWAWALHERLQKEVGDTNCDCPYNWDNVRVIRRHPI